MLYKDKYAVEIKNLPAPGYHDDYKSIDFEVEKDLLLTDRFIRCYICFLGCRFVDVTHEGASVAVCSEECRQQSLTWYQEAREQELANDGTSDATGLPEVAVQGSDDPDPAQPG